ncbi:MAG: nuclear transport factor 2 family protein [Bdellovibrionales bacterium]|nr:nuclear transport factor 2 family protein [Bdellovibrionales bacterium]
MNKMVSVWMVFLSLSGAAYAAEGAPVQPALSVEEFFNGLNKDTMDLVDRFYAVDTHFLDPVVDLRGREAVRKYYENLYRNVESIRFEFSGMVQQGDDQVAFWTMVLRAKGLNGGKEVRVIGNSHFRFEPSTRLAVYHRDYFDMGEFIYERLPVLGGLIRYIKSRFSQSN